MAHPVPVQHALQRKFYRAPVAIVPKDFLDARRAILAVSFAILPFSPSPRNLNVFLGFLARQDVTNDRRTRILHSFHFPPSLPQDRTFLELVLRLLHLANFIQRLVDDSRTENKLQLVRIRTTFCTAGSRGIYLLPESLSGDDDFIDNLQIFLFFLQKN